MRYFLTGTAAFRDLDHGITTFHTKPWLTDPQAFEIRESSEEEMDREAQRLANEFTKRNEAVCFVEARLIREDGKEIPLPT